MGFGGTREALAIRSQRTRLRGGGTGHEIGLGQVGMVHFGATARHCKTSPVDLNGSEGFEVQAASSLRQTHKKKWWVTPHLFWRAGKRGDAIWALNIGLQGKLRNGLGFPQRPSY